MSIRSVSAGALALMLATMAQAQCPGHVSEGAIRLERAEPILSSVFRATPTGLSEARILARDGEEEDVSATYAHALAPVDRLSDGETITLRYGADTSDLERLPDRETWRSEVVVAINGQVVAAGSVTKTRSGSETVGIGACDYRAWLVEDRLDVGLGDDTWFLQYYVPELGLVVRSLKMSGTGEVIDGVIFDGIALAGT